MSLPDVRIWIDRKGASKAGRRGEILFTHTGLSGPAVLDISGDVAALLYRSANEPQSPRPGGLVRGSDVVVRLNLIPDMTAAGWLARFDQWQHASGARSVVTMLAEYMPHSLARILCETVGVAQPPDEMGENALVLPPLPCAAPTARPAASSPTF